MTRPFCLFACLPLFLSCQDHRSGQKPLLVQPAQSAGIAAAVAAPAPYQGPGTRAMAGRLEAMARRVDPRQDMVLNAQRVELMLAELMHTQDRQHGAWLSLQVAEEQLNAGRPADGLRTLRSLGSPADPGLDRRVRQMRAMANLRLGEQDNCLAQHGADSCLLPIRGSGIHKLQRGSRAAIQELTALLQIYKDDLLSVWLLNIAYMTLGEYPKKVPAPWLIPPQVFASEADIGRFRNVAMETGLDGQGSAGGSIMEDFDGDGYLDIVTSGWGLRDPMHFFHNNGDGSFADRTAAAGLTGEVGGLNLVQADYDNDGHPDILVLRDLGPAPISLLRNQGDGTFDDVTAAAGLLRFQATQVGVFFDYDNDGWLDLFIGAEGNQPVHLYHNNHDGSFSDRSVDLGVDPALGTVKGLAAGDYNNDGRQDLFVSVQEGKSKLFRNNGRRRDRGPRGEDWVFTEVGRQAGVAPRDFNFSFTSWFWDYDNDGWPDLFVAGDSRDPEPVVAKLYFGRASDMELPRLYHNNRDGSFTDVTRAARLDRVGMVMGGNFGDFDDDGYLDCYLGTGAPDLRALVPNRMFRNAGGKFFQDVTTSAGVGHLQKGHGVAIGDIDNDGDLDIFEKMGGAFEGDLAHSVLFENPGNRNHFISLRLEGRRSNRSAIGARIQVHVKGKTGERDIYATISSGSFGGSPLEQHIGLGDAVAIGAIKLTWPATGRVQTFRHPQMDRFYQIIEDQDRLIPQERTAFSLSEEELAVQTDPSAQIPPARAMANTAESL